MRTALMTIDEYTDLVKRVCRYVKNCMEPPTIRTIARTFGLTISETYTLAEDAEMIINVGTQIQGFGYYQEPHKGDYTLEVAGD